MISVVIPINNEEESLIALHEELDAVFGGGAMGRSNSSLWTTAVATDRGGSWLHWPR